MIKEEDKIELRSEEFQEVLGSVPHWILRWGLTLLGVIVIVLLIGSAIFKYPDIISTPMTLTGSSPATGIVARTSGKINKIYVQNNQDVNKGDYLAIIENPAKTEDIIYLKYYVQELNLDGNLTTLSKKEINLGNLQSLYSSFYMILSEYQQFVQLKYYPNKIESINKRIAQYESQYSNLQRQKSLIDQQRSLSHKQFNRDSLLKDRGVLSVEDFEKSHNQYLQGHLSYENICSSLDNMRIQIAQLKETLLDTEQQYIEKSNSLKTQLNTQKAQLLNEIQTWEINYAIIAPITGKVIFTGFWAENQNIQVGNEVFNIVPEETPQLIGKAQLPMMRSGKVKIGQKVNIRFENFPDHEFGMVKWIIKNISLVPTKTGEQTNYTVEINLPNGLMTTYKRELPYLPEMTAQADIITEDLSLLERLFMPIRKILNENIR